MSGSRVVNALDPLMSTKMTEKGPCERWRAMREGMSSASPLPVSWSVEQDNARLT